MNVILLLAVLLGAFVAGPPIVRKICDEWPERWFTAAGTVRAGVLLLGGIIIAGWPAVVGELAALMALIVWLVSGQLRAYLSEHGALRGQVLTAIAAAQPSQSALWRHLQVYLLVALAPEHTHGTGDASSVAPRNTPDSHTQTPQGGAA